MKKFREFNAVIKDYEILGAVKVTDMAKEKGEVWYECTPIEFKSETQWIPAYKLKPIKKVGNI